MFTVKPEPVDDEKSLPSESVTELAVQDVLPSVLPSMPTRRLQVMVVVPTLKGVNDMRKKLAKELLVKPQFKIKTGAETKFKKQPKGYPSFDLDTINRRLDKLGPDRNYEVNIADEIKFTAVPRRFLSDTWGGNTQNTFPSIRKEMLLKHGLNDWQYPNSLYNPHCPLNPGFAGLMFSPDGLENHHDDGPAEESLREWRTIVRLKTEARWQYVGQYVDVAAPSLTKKEWLIQDLRVRKTWAKEIWRKGWGWRVRVRVTLRKDLRREPDETELENAYEDVDNAYKEITVDDVQNAYDRGEELLGVYILKCVGYDEAFQREIYEKIQDWVPPPAKEKRKRGGRGRKTQNKRRRKEGQKNPPAEADSEEDTPEEGSDDEMFESEDEEIGFQYVLKGTKSRPRRG